MENNEKISLKKVKVVRKVNVPATIRQIPHGETVRFARQELGSESVVRSAIWRENAKCKDPEFTLELVDLGMFYDITRK